MKETGLRAQSLELFGVFSGRELHYVYPNGDEVSNIDIVYICRAYTGELQCQEEEVECLRFFDADACRSPFRPRSRRCFAAGRRAGGKPCRRPACGPPAWRAHGQYIEFTRKAAFFGRPFFLLCAKYDILTIL